MAIVGIGVDVVDLVRFQSVLHRTPRMVERLFSQAERTRPDGHPLSAESLAGRFAVKEAVAKALGAPAGMTFLECEVSTEGQPSITLSGEVARVSDSLGITRWHVSLSHDGPVVIAYVIAEAHN